MKAVSLSAQPVAAAALLGALLGGRDSDRLSLETGRVVLGEALRRATQLDDAAADVVLSMLLKRSAVNFVS